MEDSSSYPSESYDPSDEAEVERIKARSGDLGESEYDADEQRAILAELTGIDPSAFAD
jgi:hypothetical protein